jgi:hypothetical protein
LLSYITVLINYTNHYVFCIIYTYGHYEVQSSWIWGRRTAYSWMLYRDKCIAHEHSRLEKYVASACCHGEFLCSFMCSRKTFWLLRTRHLISSSLWLRELLINSITKKIIFPFVMVNACILVNNVFTDN